MIDGSIDMPQIDGPIDSPVDCAIDNQSDWSDYPEGLSDLDDDPFEEPIAKISNHELDEIPLDVDPDLEKTYMVRAERIGQVYLNERDLYHHHTAKQRYEFENEPYVPGDRIMASIMSAPEPCGRINTTKPGAEKFTYQKIPKNWTKIAKKTQRVKNRSVKTPARCSLTPPTIQPPPPRTNWAAVKRAMHAKPKTPVGRPKKYANKAELNAARNARYREKHPKNETLQKIVLEKPGKQVTKNGHKFPTRIAQLPFGQLLSQNEVRALELKGAYYKKTGGYLSDKLAGTIMMGNDGQLYHQIGEKVKKMKVSKDLTVTWGGKKFMLKQFVGVVITEEQLAAKREKDQKRYKK